MLVTGALGATRSKAQASDKIRRTAVRKVTITLNNGNLELDGLAFRSSNQSGIDIATIHARGTSGDVGLDMAFPPGIGLLPVNNVCIGGGQDGIVCFRKVR